MKSVNFSVDRIAKFACQSGKRQSFYRDGKTPGLGLRVTAAGAKTYVFETRLRSRTLRMTIGDERTWSIAAAQREATRLKTLTDRGLDPRRVKAEQEAAEDAERRKQEGDAILVGEAWADYMKQRADSWGPDAIAGHISASQPGGVPKKKGGGPGVTKPGILVPILKLRLKEVTASVLTDWVKTSKAYKEGITRSAFLIFRTFWRWCATRAEYKALIDVGVLEDADLREAVPERKDKRFDVLQRSQLKAWFREVRALPNPAINAFLQVLILTGARRNEMAQLRWKDIDFKWKTIWLNDKVEDVGRKIPLTPYVSRLLGALPRKGEWVFHSEKSQNGRIREPRKAHSRVLAAAGLEHVSVHGLRRTFASLAEWLEMPRGVVAQIMGHKPNATAERHYINRPIELLAVWHNKYETWILGQAAVKDGRKPSAGKTKPATKTPPRLRLVSSR